MEQDILRLALENQKVSAALEERADGAAQKEREYVFYARLGEGYEMPSTDDKERQEQWTIKIPMSDANAAQGDIRVRKTDLFDHGDLGQTEYVLTTKVRGDDVDEVPIVSTADQFMHFKRLAESGMLKDRYTYPIEGTDLKWEVDVFLKPGGGFWPWVKIDLEVPGDAPADFPIPAFPIEAEEWIKAQDGERTPAEEAQVRELYDTMFLTKNPQAKNTLGESAAAKDDIKDDQKPDTDAKPATEAAQTDWQAKWPELDGVPLHPDLVPSDEIFASDEAAQVQSEPDENRPVVGCEQIQEFNSKVEQLAKDMNVRLLHLSIGRGYLSHAELMKLAEGGEKSPKMVPIAQGGPYGSQYYYVKNPAEGSSVVGAGFHFNHPTLSPDQVTF
jgi:hypothetical protein